MYHGTPVASDECAPNETGVCLPFMEDLNDLDESCCRYPGLLGRLSGRCDPDVE